MSYLGTSSLAPWHYHLEVVELHPEMCSGRSITSESVGQRFESSNHYSNKGKFHCTADLLFDSIIYIQISKFVANVYVAMQLNPMQTKVEVSRTVIDPLIKL